MALLAPMTDTRRFAVVILAAGQGTRMRSDTHKVLHPIASRPLLLHLLDRVDRLGADRRVVVVGKGRDQVEVALNGRDVTVVHQAEQKGTGHAVQQAADALAGYDGAVLVLYGDTPFVEVETLSRMLDRLNGEGGPGVVVLGSSPADAAKYGRIILGEGDRIARMVEYRDATEEERAVRLCNSGMMAVRAADLFRWLGEVGNDNAAKEYYLPDVVNIAASEGREAVVIEGDPYETAGVNSRAELAHLELEWQRRRREEVLEEGATLIDPESVWFAYDTKLARDVTVEPHVVFGPGVQIAEGAVIKAFSHIEGAIIGSAREHRPVREDPPRDQAWREEQGRQFRRAQEGDSRPRGQGQSSKLRRRRRSRRGGQYRRRHHHLQLRRVRKVSHGDRRGRVYRLQHRTGRPGDDWRRSGDRRRIGDHRGRRGRRLAVERAEQKGVSGWAKRFRERMSRKAAE